MAWRGALATLTVMALLAGVLQGCGCDPDRVATCTARSGCDGVRTYMNCIKDSGCCGDTSGQNFKEIIQNMIDTENLANNCGLSSPC